MGKLADNRSGTTPVFARYSTQKNEDHTHWRLAVYSVYGSFTEFDCPQRYRSPAEMLISYKAVDYTE